MTFKKSKGHATIALHGCKNMLNVGGALRAAGCYQADLIVLDDRRLNRNGDLKYAATDTTRSWRHTPLLKSGDIMKMVPFDAVPVAVDIVPEAVSLIDFEHPARAFYVFGPEDGTLGPDILGQCQHVVKVPTSYCMNLAATVNVVLYDRLSKQQRQTS